MSNVVDELSYRSYAYNRLRTPGRPARSYAPIFGAQVEALEARFQAEHPDICHSAAEFMEGELSSGQVSRNTAAGPTLSEVFLEQTR